LPHVRVPENNRRAVVVTQKPECAAPEKKRCLSQPHEHGISTAWIAEGKEPTMSAALEAHDEEKALRQPRG